MGLIKLSILVTLAIFLFVSNAIPLSMSSDYALKERNSIPPGWRLTDLADKTVALRLHIGLKQSNEGLIEKHLTEISNPRHSRYGQHLTAQEVNDIVRPSNVTMDMVTAWLEDHDVAINATSFSPAMDWLSITVPIAKAETLLQTSYSMFQHTDGSRVVRTLEWSLPRHLHRHIDVVQPTTAFITHRSRQRRPLTMPTGRTPEDSGRNATGHKARLLSRHEICQKDEKSLGCLRAMYGTAGYVPRAPDRNRMGIVNLIQQTNQRYDIAHFLGKFRPEAYSSAQSFEIDLVGAAEDNQEPIHPGSQAYENHRNGEGTPDAEIALGMTWPTPLTAFSVATQSYADISHHHETIEFRDSLILYVNHLLALDDLPQVISHSYGLPESTMPISYARRICSGFAQLGARGVSIVFASGDSGVQTDGNDPNCIKATTGDTPFAPDFPASCPWVTAVGATRGYEPEVASLEFGSGAGFSNYFERPDYQSRDVMAYINRIDGKYKGQYNATGRAFPDVAAVGENVLAWWAGREDHFTGTSASAPIFASVISLVNDALLAKGKPPLGFLNPWLYTVARNALDDVTLGSSWSCQTCGFPAGKGWDPVTGLGTPDFRKLVEAAFEVYKFASH